tara:strand:- start:221 stop:592 length:372 start_codon:yes stop_codon:yes gene_type:complete
MENAKFHDIFGKTQVSFGEVPYYPTMDASGLPIFPVGSSITTEEFKLKYDEVEKDYSINKLRIERNVLLKDCDWVMMSDLDLANKDEWITYRQALRDLPKTQSGVTTDIAGNLIDAVFPIKPE